MGREAVCTCDWAGEITEVKALLESHELILRGAIRKRVPFDEISDVKVDEDGLRFRVDRDGVQLVLGAADAAKWAASITGPPLSLARKLGIRGDTIVRIIGHIEDANLKAALAEAKSISARGESMIVAVVDMQESLSSALKQAMPALKKGVPIWIVYKKGAGNALNETAIRAFFRDSGLVDTKVVSVSAKYTALRFIFRK